MVTGVHNEEETFRFLMNEEGVGRGLGVGHWLRGYRAAAAEILGVFRPWMDLPGNGKEKKKK